MSFTTDEKYRINTAKEKIRSKIRRYTEDYPAIPWNNMFLTGGAIGSILRNETPNDYDIYCKKSSEVLLPTIKDFYFSNVKSYDEKYAHMGDGTGKLITDNAITMDNGVQFITCLVGSPEDVKKKFDYVHCCPHYDIETDTLYISRKQFDACMGKKLILNNTENLKTWREHKFLNAGWQYV